MAHRREPPALTDLGEQSQQLVRSQVGDRARRTRARRYEPQPAAGPQTRTGAARGCVCRWCCVVARRGRVRRARRQLDDPVRTAPMPTPAPADSVRGGRQARAGRRRARPEVESAHACRVRGAMVRSAPSTLNAALPRRCRGTSRCSSWSDDQPGNSTQAVSVSCRPQLSKRSARWLPDLPAVRARGVAAHPIGEDLLRVAHDVESSARHAGRAS